MIDGIFPLFSVHYSGADDESPHPQPPKNSESTRPSNHGSRRAAMTGGAMLPQCGGGVGLVRKVVAAE
ncbi:hypothetical protein BJX64DRAFT_261991 [Aspergillus heterothallicus]